MPKNKSSKDFNNLDELCRTESTCVFPYCGQKIERGYFPQQLLQKGVQIPVPVLRTAINRYIRHPRFSCHNCCYQHCVLVFVWLFLLGLFLMGLTFMLVFDFSDNLVSYCINYTRNGGCIYGYRRRQDDRRLGYFIGLGFMVSSIALLLLHVVSCVLCRCLKQLAEFLQVQKLCGQTPFNKGRNRIAPMFHPPPHPPQLQQPSGSLTQNRSNNFETEARSLILKHSARYLQCFIEKDLPDVTSQLHTLQKCCLCQFVQMPLQPTGAENVISMQYYPQQQPLQQQHHQQQQQQPLHQLQQQQQQHAKNVTPTMLALQEQQEWQHQQQQQQQRLQTSSEVRNEIHVEATACIEPLTTTANE